MKKHLLSNVLLYITALLLFLAVLEWPRGHYTFVQLVVFYVCGYYAIMSYQRADPHKEIPSWVWGLGGLALLFNPFIPATLPRELWQFADVVGGVFLLMVTRWKK